MMMMMMMMSSTPRDDDCIARVFAVIIVPVVVVIFLMERDECENLSRHPPINFFAKEEELRQNLHKIGSQTT